MDVGGKLGFDSGRLMRWSVALLLIYAVVLFGCYQQQVWFVTPEGLMDIDFVNVWAAGRLTLDGQAPAVYERAVHRAMEVAVLGHDFPGYYGWHYPPMLLFAAAPLALLGYLPAWACWSALTAAFLVWTLWRIVPSRAVVVALMASPASLWCVVSGQNGFLTAGLVAGALGFAERRPVVAGIFLGLLTYKPQFGVLFPVALIAGRQWRMIASASVTAALAAGASALVFGADTWLAFFHSVTVTVNDVLRTGGPGWGKLQSVYALLRGWGVADGLAMAVQGVVVVALAAIVVWLYRRPVSPALRAAVLAAMVPLAAPYSYVYDLPVLAVSAAFVVQDGLRRGYLRGDYALLLAAMLTPFLFHTLWTATGMIAAALLGCAVARRVRQVPA